MSKAKGNTFLAVRDLGGLKPADDIGEEIMRRIRVGDLVEVTVVRKRDIKLHRLYWVLLGLIWHNLPPDAKPLYPKLQTYHRQMKKLCGVVEHFVDYVPKKLPDGRIRYEEEESTEVGSIAFDKMDDIEFVEFFNNVCMFAIDYWLPTVTIQQLRWEAERVTGYDVESAVEARRRRRLKMEERAKLIEGTTAPRKSLEELADEDDDAMEA